MMSGLGPSGQTLDFFAFNSSNAVWNGAAFVTFADADYQSYRITATELGTSGRYTGTEPTGAVRYELRLRDATLAGSVVFWEDALTVALADGGLTAAKIAADAITAAKIATGAIDADALATDAVTEIAGGVNTALGASHGTGSWEDAGGGGTGGSGAYAVTTTVLDADAVPIAGAAVRLRNLTSNDVANTDVDGLATLNKDAGTYTRIVTAAGYEAFTDTVVVDGDETLSDVELTAIVIAPATSDDQCNCYLDTKDAAGTLQGGVTHLFRLSTLPTGDGSSYGPLIEATSEDDETSEDFGRLEVLLKRGATYLMQRGETWENESADQVTVEVPNNAGPFELPNVWSNDN